MGTKMKETKDAFVMLGIGSAAAVLSAWAVNMTPGIKTANPTIKSLAQLTIGMGAVLFAPGKYRVARYAGMGIAWAGALGAVERMTSMKTLAGPAAGLLSPSEVRALQSMGAINMNGPMAMRRMNGPQTMAPMGTQPSMMGGFKAPT
jgi:hypothetical protein